MSIKEEIKYFCLGGVYFAILLTIGAVFAIVAIALAGGFIYITDGPGEIIVQVLMGGTLTLIFAGLFYSFGKDVKKKGFWNVLKFKDWSKTQ